MDDDNGYFILHTQMIKCLQDDLIDILGEDITSSVLFRFGFKSGSKTSENMGLRAYGNGAIDYFEEIWMQSGVGRTLSCEEMDEGFQIVMEETIESMHQGTGCDFTRGFISGVITQMTGLPYYCEEERCVSRGDDRCIFIVKEDGLEESEE